MRGRFVAFEGMDGSGKSTQLRAVADRLRELGIDVVTTREPGGTPMAEEFRSVLLTLRDEAVSPITEILAMLAAREQHLNNVIRPALAAGKWVLSDRFVASSFSYQVRARGVSEDLYNSLVRHVVADTMPDVTLIFNMSDEEAANRLGLRTEKADRLDLEERAFHQKVNAALRELVGKPGYREIDAGRTKDAITEEIISILAQCE